MYSTADIADYLERDERSVRYYIEKGFLKASLVDGNYEISSKDFADFKENYYYSDRFKNKGKWKTVDEDSLNELTKMIDMISNGSTIEQIIVTFSKSEIRIPTEEAFNRHKRDKAILNDKIKGMSREDIAIKHGLSVKGVERIIYKDTGDDQYTSEVY